MKDSLAQITQQIIDSNEIVVDKFQVFEESDSLPEIIENIEFQSEFLVCLWVNYNDALIAQKQYESFIHKPVGIVQNHHHSVLYWFEGFKAKNENKGVNLKLGPIIPSGDAVLKSFCNLPSWLEQSIFDKHQATYAPDHNRYKTNLDLSSEELKVYLGTYFPRSYGESFCIFDNIFDNKEYSNLAKKEDIKILDIGCGTGGNLLGLLVSINKYSVATRNVNILAVDGHSSALNILNDLVDEFAKIATFSINITTKKHAIHSTKDLQFITDSNFDFIMSFKMGCELITEGYQNVYYDLASVFMPLLSQTGLFLLLDVTTKAGADFNPILLNNQINRAIIETSGYKSFIPITCGEFEKECTERCFTQRYFSINHKNKSNDISKVAYRIICKTSFANRFKFFKNEYNYFNRINTSPEEVLFCPMSKGVVYKDNYKI